MMLDDKLRVALVSCVKTKRATASAARDLYTSPWFRHARLYAERHADVWYILSAEHGVLPPDRVIQPYEKTLSRMPRGERMAWARRVHEQLIELLPSKATVMLLAGRSYRDGVEEFLRLHGHSIEIPLEGLRSGQQLQFLARDNGRHHAS